MKFTDEQEAVIESSGNIKINAVAGSGKTTVLVEYARRQNPREKILYLAFNRSVRIEAQKRFAKENMTNVDVQTAHSLAYRRITLPFGYQVSTGYKLHDIVRILALESSGRDPHSAYIIASHIQKFVNLFCNSTAEKVQELDYSKLVTDPVAHAYVKRSYAKIEQGTRQFLAKMDRKEIDVTHDFYLKKFQLSQPQLGYDIVLFDEGQDASPVMLDVFLAQDAKKVIVGDVHQQIYGWRHAINALRHADFPTHSLTTSFRFNENIAGLAMECLAWKRLLGEAEPVQIHGVGTNKKICTRATLARTNLALLREAIYTMQNDRTVGSVYFEGNINSYTYAADGASIYDVLNLYLDKHDRVRDPVISTMKEFGDLKEYADKSEDIELGMLIDIVEEYGKEIPFLLKKLSAMHVSDDKREKADMIFSTLHRCKGMEYDMVTLTEDFMNRERLRKTIEKKEKEPIDLDRLNEEINLVYVAVTRSRNFLDFPDYMFPNADKTLFVKKRTGEPIRPMPKKKQLADFYASKEKSGGAKRKKKSKRWF